jgi:hypothetical protein
MSEGGRGGQGGQGGRGGSATSSNDARFYGGNYSYEVGPTNVSPIINNQVQVGLGGLANAIQQAAGQDAVGSIAPNSIGDCTKMLEMASAQGNPAEWIATHAPYCAGAGFDPTN